MSQSLKSHAKSFDDATKLTIDSLAKQVFDAGNKKNIAQTVADALTVRQTAALALLSRAESSAGSAEQTFHDGRVVAQTVLNGYGHALEANVRAEKIREEMQQLYQRAYTTATTTVDAAQKLEDFVKSVQAYKAKNDHFSSDVAASMPRLLETAQTALSTTLTALQRSMVALASAEEAALSTASVVRESKNLLKHLLPQAAKADTSVPVTNLRQFPLYQYSSPHLNHFTQDLEAAAQKGLLYLLDAIRQLREFARTEMNGLASEVGMELNAARHVLDKASQHYNNVQASMTAASAAV